MEKIKIIIRIILIISIGICFFSYLAKNPFRYDDKNTNMVTGVCTGYRDEETTVWAGRATHSRVTVIITIDNTSEYLISERELKYIQNRDSEFLHKEVTIMYHTKSRRIVDFRCGSQSYFSSDVVEKSNSLDWVLLCIFYSLIVAFTSLVTIWQIKDIIREQREIEEKEKKKALKKRKRQEALIQKELDNSKK